MFGFMGFFIDGGASISEVVNDDNSGGGVGGWRWKRKRFGGGRGPGDGFIDLRRRRGQERAYLIV